MNVIAQHQGKNYTIYNADCVDVAAELPDDSIGFSVFSPPFASLYTYSDSDRDMGNCRSYEEFFTQFGYLVRELYRVIRPGRIVAFHCMNIPAMKERDGYIGLKDFRGDLIRCFQKGGFIFHSEHCIWKDPLVEATRTKAIGLMHKQLCKDSTMSRAGIPDYLVAMRKPGENTTPVSHSAGLTDFYGENPPVRGVLSHERWRRYASPVWMDINQSRTLQYASARENDDEKHICLASGTLVLTQKGYIPIEDVCVGDITLTHTGKWKPIIAKKLTRQNAEVVKVNAIGVPHLICTPDHKIWVRGIGNTTTRPIDAMSRRAPEWVEAQELEKHYVNMKLPPVEMTDLSMSDLWIVGRWLADGHVDARGHQYFISVGSHKEAEFIEHAKPYIGKVRVDYGTSIQFGLVIKSESLRRMLKKCGCGAANKRLPIDLISLDKEHADALLSGYLSGDGYVSANGHVMCTSVSRALLLGMAMVVQRATGKIASVYAGRSAADAIIERRKVHCQQEWILHYCTRRYQFSKVLDDGAWMPVKSVTKSKNSDVWSIRVEEDASFTAEGCIVKNCPLQLDVIDRALVLWSAEGDVVMSPFMGIGSEGYEAVKMGRKFVGVELKQSYYKVAARNLADAEHTASEGELFAANGGNEE